MNRNPDKEKLEKLDTLTLICVCVTKMEVIRAVSAAVILKLEDTMNEESVADNKKLKHQLQMLQKSLEQQEKFLDEEDVSQKTRDHLLNLYEVEDEIDIFSFQVARQRKTFFFKNFSSCRRLKQKMKKIQSRISSSEDVVSAIPGLINCSKSDQWSVNSPHTGISDTTTSEEYHSDDDDDEDDDFYYETQALTLKQKSVSNVWPISESPSPEHKKLTFSYSYKEKERNMRGSKEENLHYPKQIPTFFHQEEVGIFGLKDDVKILVKRLTRHQEACVSRFTDDDVTSVVKQQSKQKEMFVQVVGEVGSGKTTLVRAIYKNKKIKDHFESHDWISIKHEDTADHILLGLLKNVATVKNNGGDTSFNDQSLKTRVFNHLKGKRYLIVLDGVRSCRLLEDLKEAFPYEDNGSKIIFTQRRCPETYVNMITINPHKMNQLNETESWNMFLMKVGKESGKISPRLKRRILNICKGLPLNIVLIAKLLSNKGIETWSSIVARDRCFNDAVTLCYEDLSSNSKLCLLYLSFFPKDYDIPVRRLLRLWLAEGFVNGRSEEISISPEDVVQGYFEDLVDRSLIQITKLRSDNSPRHCQLISVLHDYLLQKARDISLFNIHRNSESFENAAGPFGVRRMVHHMNSVGALATTTRAHGQMTERNKTHVRSSSSTRYLSCFSVRCSENIHDTEMRGEISTFDPSLLRSYVSFNSHGKDIAEKQVGKLLGRIIESNFRLLRVLDLEGVYMPNLPHKLGHLHHLRYLGLRRTFLESLPESVGDLSYLETLDVKHTRVETLPDSIWKLKQLRHLNLNNIRLAMPPRSSSTLVTLWGLVLDEKISVNEGVGKLLNLRELGVKFSLSETQSMLLDWIAKLENLRSLRLRSPDDMNRSSKIILKPLVKLTKLSHLDLYGTLERLPAPNEFPPTVKVLTLSISRLNKDPMETLGRLPSLIVLRLLGDSYIGKRLVCHRGGFKKLEVLKLWKLKDLEELDVEEEAMESLKELNIRGCDKLKNITSRLLQKQRCLEELVLTNMPDDLVARIKKRKFKDTSLTINYLE
ncbi:unnamed protein product [Lactuca saligna]|uniref:NB-ARC domain-containing protein n=1 Tax=Lactuca saligna TaxID=75948 RepID=A0AA36A1R8_LACSI|nr:unnamed protein product [Lactuca saligna]